MRVAFGSDHAGVLRRRGVDGEPLWRRDGGRRGDPIAELARLDAALVHDREGTP